jgi:hypothetical protein
MLLTERVKVNVSYANSLNFYLMLKLLTRFLLVQIVRKKFWSYFIEIFVHLQAEYFFLKIVSDHFPWCIRAHIVVFHVSVHLRSNQVNQSRR